MRVGQLNYMIIRQPHLEGMMSFEYNFMLSVLKELRVSTFTTYIEAFSVDGAHHEGSIKEVGVYFNKRFFKYTHNEDDLSHLPEIAEPRLSKDPEHPNLSLFGFEGPLLPTKTELNQANRCKFDIYTITNISLLDLALTHGFQVKTFAVVRTVSEGANRHVNPEIYERLHTKLLPNDSSKDLKKA